MLFLIGLLGTIFGDKKLSENSQSAQTEQTSQTEIAPTQDTATINKPTVEASEPTIKPEMTVSFIQGTVICLTKDELLELTMHAIKGEATKANSMVGCTMLLPSKKVKVLSVEYNNDKTSDIGVMEIVGAESKSSNGAWAYTTGAKETTP